MNAVLTHQQRFDRLWKILIKEIKDKRDAGQLSVSEAAHRGSLHPQTLYKYISEERGSRVPQEAIYKLGAAAGWDEKDVQKELYGDARYGYLVDKCPEALDTMYEAIKNGQDPERISALVRLAFKK